MTSVNADDVGPPIFRTPTRAFDHCAAKDIEMNTRPPSARAVEDTSTLTRTQFLKIICSAALGAPARVGGVGIGLLIGTPSYAADDAVEVYPTGLFPGDIDEVSSAINGGVGPSGIRYEGGGTVLLKATNRYGVATAFNFGDGAWPDTRGTVVIRKDVVILGEGCKAQPQMLPFDADDQRVRCPTLRVAVLRGAAICAVSAPLKPLNGSLSGVPTTRRTRRLPHPLLAFRAGVSATRFTESYVIETAACVRGRTPRMQRLVEAARRQRS